MVSSNLERGFVILNVLLLAFGAWCFLWPVRRGWPVAASLAWFWVVIEIINGIGHPLWSLREGGLNCVMLGSVRVAVPPLATSTSLFTRSGLS